MIPRILAVATLSATCLFAAAAPAHAAGGFEIRSDDGISRMKIGGRVQPQLSVPIEDDGGDGSRVRGAFSLDEARIWLKGRALLAELGFKLEAGWDNGAAVLRDYWLDYELQGVAHLRAGQWKRPFSRQKMSSSGRRELVGSAITDSAFGAGRDIGVAVHDAYDDKKPLEWIVGVFNGTGEQPWVGDRWITTVPRDFGPTAVARVGWKHGGIKGYEEGDLEGGPLRWGAAGSFRTDLGETSRDTAMRYQLEVDGVVKVDGASLSAAYYLQWDRSGSERLNGELDQSGFFAQAGYLLAGRYEPAARYARVARDGPRNDDDELTAGLAVYWFGHNLKLNTEISALGHQTDAGVSRDWRARAELQLEY